MKIDFPIKPFTPVLYRESKEDEWSPVLFSHVDVKGFDTVEIYFYFSESYPETPYECEFCRLHGKEQYIGSTSPIYSIMDMDSFWDWYNGGKHDL